LAEKQDITMIRKLPLTYARQGVTCSSDMCEIEIYVFFPVILKNNKFSLSRLLSIPVAKDTYLGALKWKQVELKDDYSLSDGNMIYALNEKELPKCQKQIEHLPCEICEFDSIPDKLVDDCVASVFADKNETQLEKVCEWNTITEPEEMAVKIDHDEWAYVDVNPGSITETCTVNDKQQIKNLELSHSGVIRFKPDCQYNIINGPFKGINPFIPRVRIETLTGVSRSNNKVKQLSDDVSIVQIHFRDYGIIYVTSLGGLVIIVTGCAVYCWCVRRRTLRDLFQLRSCTNQPSAPAIVEMRTITNSRKQAPGPPAISYADPKYNQQLRRLLENNPDIEIV
jgi:hypothetical protein